MTPVPVLNEADAIMLLYAVFQLALLLVRMENVWSPSSTTIPAEVPNAAKPVNVESNGWYVEDADDVVR